MASILPQNVDERFLLSLDLESHPMKLEKSKLKRRYYLVLEYFIKQVDTSEITLFRLNQYKQLLTNSNINSTVVNIDKVISLILSPKPLAFNRAIQKSRYRLLLDIALILNNEEKARKVYDMMKSYIPPYQLDRFEQVIEDMFSGQPYALFDSYLFKQYLLNQNHTTKENIKVVVTANMSAGKSTFINALIGKPLARTSQEVCTGNISYIYNKPFEDEATHMLTDSMNMNATPKEQKSLSWDSTATIATYFNNNRTRNYQVCIMDTPGVNSALNHQHEQITKEFLKTDDYDKVVYILNANKLGTEDEISYLKWVANNVKKDKVVFILNKIDDFNAKDDSIDASIEGVKKDLFKAGFNNPIICPMSSYCAFLVKMKQTEQELDEDEQDEYDFYNRKFNRPAYNLSKYYNNTQMNTYDTEEALLSKRCGLYGVEKIIFG